MKTNERRKVFDKFMLRNEEGDILTDKEIVLNIKDRDNPLTIRIRWVIFCIL